MNNQSKSLGYTLFVDEEMDGLFHIFGGLFDSFEEFSESEGGVDSAERAVRERMKEVFQRFVKATSDPSHELGWCKDPTCNWVSDSKKK